MTDLDTQLLIAWSAAEAHSLAWALNAALDTAGDDAMVIRDAAHDAMVIRDAESVRDRTTWVWQVENHRHHLSLDDAMIEIRQFLAEHVEDLQRVLAERSVWL